jgi:hypothetical protein
VDISTPRKLLLWAYALAHGRTGSVAEAVKYCEEQTKVEGLSILVHWHLSFSSFFLFVPTLNPQ